MASLTWILLFCTLLPAVSCNTGLYFNIARSVGSPNCATTECTYDAAEQNNAKFGVKQISIYDVTQSSNKFQLASRKFGDADIYVDPTKTNDINGTSEVTQFHAGLRLNFRNVLECLYETLVCEVVYIDDSGKRQTVRKTIAPDTPDVDNDCSCSAITYSLDTLTNRANGASRQLYGLALNLDNIRVDLNGVRNGTTELSSNIARLQESHENIQVSVDQLRATEKEVDSQLNKLRNANYIQESKITNLQNVDGDIKEDIATLRQNDRNADKQLSQLARSDSSQLGSIDALQQADGVYENDIKNLQQSDNDLADRVGNLRNESSSLRNQFAGLTENDKSLRAAISVLSSHDQEIQGAIKGLRATDNEIDRYILQLNRNNVELLEDAAQASQRTSDKVREINELSQIYSGIESDINRLEQNDRSINNKIGQLNEKDAEISSALNAFLTVDVNTRKGIDSLQSANAAIQDSIAYLRRNDTAFGLQISDLIVNDRVVDTQINQLSSGGSAVRSAIEAALTQQRDVRSQLDVISSQLTLLSTQIETAKITTVSKTTSSLVLTSCTRGMPHQNARAPIVILNSVPALCDTETDGGGWIIVQRRTNGNEKFYRSWSDYKSGFGSPSGDYYIGNDNLAQLSDAGFTEARIDLVYKGKPVYAYYSTFRVEGEDAKYRLRVGGYEGTAPDSLSYHDGSKFSTYDQDNDRSRDNCAKSKSGGWWYNDCYEANLNGVWGATGETGVIWKGLSDTQSVSFTEIKVRAPASY